MPRDNFKDLRGWDSQHGAEKGKSVDRQLIEEGLLGSEAIRNRLENPQNRRERKIFKAIKKRYFK